MRHGGMKYKKKLKSSNNIFWFKYYLGPEYKIPLRDTHTRIVTPCDIRSISPSSIYTHIYIYVYISVPLCHGAIFVFRARDHVWIKWQRAHGNLSLSSAADSAHFSLFPFPERYSHYGVVLARAGMDFSSLPPSQLWRPRVPRPPHVRFSNTRAARLLRFFFARVAEIYTYVCMYMWGRRPICMYVRGPGLVTHSLPLRGRGRLLFFSCVSRARGFVITGECRRPLGPRRDFIGTRKACARSVFSISPRCVFFPWSGVARIL